MRIAGGPEGLDGQDDEQGGEGEVQALEPIQRQPGAGQGSHRRAGDPEALEQQLQDHDAFGRPGLGLGAGGHRVGLIGEPEGGVGAGQPPSHLMQGERQGVEDVAAVDHQRGRGHRQQRGAGDGHGDEQELQ
jgi:hypothetical protein